MSYIIFVVFVAVAVTCVAVATPKTSCSHVGYYCGNDGLGLDANNLYYCSGPGATPSLSSGTDCDFTW